MSKFIHQNSQYVKLVSKSESLESLSVMDELPGTTNNEHSPDTKLTVLGTSFSAQEFKVMESFN